MRLNVGCGADVRPGWVNVDCRRLHPEGEAFWCCDIRDLGERVEDESMDEVCAMDLLQFLPWRDVGPVLIALARKLRPGGRLYVEVPDLEEVVRSIADGRVSAEVAERALYGAQGYPEDTCRSFWTAGLVDKRLAMVGVVVERLEQQDGRIRAWGRRPS
jgi:hypothetical protein